MKKGIINKTPAEILEGFIKQTKNNINGYDISKDDLFYNSSHYSYNIDNIDKLKNASDPFLIRQSFSDLLENNKIPVDEEGRQKNKKLSTYINNSYVGRDPGEPDEIRPVVTINTNVANYSNDPTVNNISASVLFDVPVNYFLKFVNFNFNIENEIKWFQNKYRTILYTSDYKIKFQLETFFTGKEISQSSITKLLDYMKLLNSVDFYKTIYNFLEFTPVICNYFQDKVIETTFGSTLTANDFITYSMQSLIITKYHEIFKWAFDKPEIVSEFIKIIKKLGFKYI